MVIVTRGRGRIDTLCQMLCRFHAQITQQQRHRLRASQTTGIAKCPQRNSSRTIKQRPGNDQALYANTPAGKNLLALFTRLHQ